MTISNRKILLICKVLILSLMLTAFPWRELAADSNTHGEYDAYPFDIAYEQNSTWNNSTQGQFTITNTSDHAAVSGIGVPSKRNLQQDMEPQ